VTPRIPAHRAPTRVTRRRVLGIAGLAAVPAVTFAGLRSRTKGSAAEATPRGSAGASASAPAKADASPAPKVVTEGGGPVPFKPGKAMLGAYLDLDGKTLTQSLALRRQQLGRDERILHVFYAWTDTLPVSIPGMPAGTIPMISWRGAKYAGILSGRYDSMIARTARRLATTGKPTMLRWAWEMNGDWYAWGGVNNPEQSAGFVKAWKHVWGIFADQGAKNVSWVWSPNWLSTPTDSWNQVQAYYPGDKYVDWVAMSGYDLRRETPETLFDKVYARYSPTKPIMIAEVGSVDRGGTTKGDWITTFARWADQRPGVGAVTWFDTDTHPGYDEKWRIDTDPASLAAYKSMADSARFSG
jgi:hypothetical protein